MRFLWAIDVNVHLDNYTVHTSLACRGVGGLPIFDIWLFCMRVLGGHNTVY